MIHVTLFRQRRVWLPTISGWFLLLALGIAMIVYCVCNIYSFLAPNQPADARILVVEGWLSPEELDQAVRTFKTGGYERIITTGGPISGWPELMINTDYAKVAGDYLTQHGIPQDAIIVVSTPKSAQERTFLSAVELRESARRLRIKLEAIDLFSSGAHARRSRLLYQMALGPKVRVGILAARPEEYDPKAWWKTSSGVESVIYQSIGLIWVKCFFWPGPPGSQQELWAYT
jgi:uncharacterized SAM-binding protein YcdF (DUF218 family)